MESASCASPHGTTVARSRNLGRTVEGMRSPSSTFRPIAAETSTYRSPTGTEAYDWVRIVFLRSGTAIVYSEFGAHPVRPGDVLLLGPTFSAVASRKAR